MISSSLTCGVNVSRLDIAYRNQWININNAFVNYELAFDSYIDKYKSGVGATISNYVEAGGVYTHTIFSFSGKQSLN